MDSSGIEWLPFNTLFTRSIASLTSFKQNYTKSIVETIRLAILRVIMFDEGD